MNSVVRHELPLCTELCHLLRRLLNLELLLQFGPRAWQAHIRHLEVAHKGCAVLLRRHIPRTRHLQAMAALASYD